MLYVGITNNLSSRMSWHTAAGRRNPKRAWVRDVWTVSACLYPTREHAHTAEMLNMAHYLPIGNAYDVQRQSKHRAKWIAEHDDPTFDVLDAVSFDFV